MNYRVLAYSPEDGWNLRGAYPTVRAANEAAFNDAPDFRYVAVVWVRPEEPRVVILRTNARYLTRLMNAASFRAVALAL